MKPTDPGPCEWDFLSRREADPDDPIAIGADLEPSTLLGAYRLGVFPMPVHQGRVLGWWSPDPRGILPLDGLRVSKSLARSAQRFVVTADTAFDAVLANCANPKRPGGWITKSIKRAYLELHRLGWAHSVETWTTDGRLVGGLYGVNINGLFAGESMFHTETDASKVALIGLIEILNDQGASLLDVQWNTPHLLSLGAIDVSRKEYFRRLDLAIEKNVTTFGDRRAQGVSGVARSQSHPPPG